MTTSINSQLINAIFSMKRIFIQEFKKQKNFCPMNYIKAEILSHLQLYQNSKMKDVAKFLGITPPSATTMIEKLVQEKLLERKKDPNDRRNIILLVTTEGETFIKKTYSQIHAIIEQTFKTLNKKDKKELIRIYGKLLNSEQ